MVDTVENAWNTPDAEQPWAELGLKSDEYARIREILGRRPTGCELAMYSVMWSEHCSYKSSKVHLRRFGVLSPDTPRGPLLAGIGQQAGVVDVGNGLAVTFKIESHNHPSYVEPYQGAATGVGGIVRDILAMGARPIAVMDPLRFGPLDAPDTARVLPGVVAGIGGYGNCLGLPNIGGEVVFDRTYYGNPLVNALCVGLLKHADMRDNAARGIGNRVIMFGAATGGDGIGGASILASETFDADGPAKRPSVQVGDPFMEKLLIEACLELFAAGVVVGIQDFGAAGISCATSEMASAGEGGMYVDLSKVVLRDPTLSPEEILMSESQERMMAVVRPEDVEEFLAICAKWDVLATDIGEVIEGDRLLIDYKGERVVDVDPRTVADDGPVYERPLARPAWIDELNSRRAEDLPRAASGDELREQVLRLAGSPNLCDKSWVTDQYDRYVRGNSVLAQPEDAGMIRIDETSGLGIALATDCNGRFVLLNPYLGAQLALCESYRNVATSGAEPVAITDCLNFGSPEDPDVMWQFQEAIMGCRWVPGAGHPGHRRQRQLLQPDRRQQHPAHPGRRDVGCDRRRLAGDAPGVRVRRGRGAAVGHDQGRAVRVVLGGRHPRPPWRHAADARPRGREGARPGAGGRGVPQAADLRARPRRRRLGAGAGRIVPAARPRRRTDAARRRSDGGAVQRVARPGDRVAARSHVRGVRGPVHRARCPVRPHRRGHRRRRDRGAAPLHHRSRRGARAVGGADPRRDVGVLSVRGGFSGRARSGSPYPAR